jgi:hypothetical protein
MIHQLGKHRYLRIAGFAIGAVVVATGAVLMTASASGLTFGPRAAGPNPSDTAVEAASISTAAGPSANCAAFMKHLAVGLSRTQADINKAIQTSIDQTLKDQVNSKELTQAQADALKQKLVSQNACSIIAGTASKSGGHAPRGAHGGAYMQQYLSAAASVLNITDAQLKTNLSKGQTLSQMATPKFTLDTFRTALIAKLQPQLDTAVKNNQMTSAQEQQTINKLKTGPLPYWDKPMHIKPAAPGTATSNS